MGKKRDLANEHIINLVQNMVGYMQGYVGDSNCPYKYNLLGAENFRKPDKCSDCESCKESFWINLESELLDRNVVK